MAQPIILTSFAAGELSPSLYARVDLAKWHIGAALLENFFVDYRGGVSNRAGTQFIGDSIDASEPSKLVRFIFSTIQAYVLVFDHLVMRVIKDGGFVQATGGGDYTVVTPYLADDLALLKTSQSADVMTLTHPNYAPMQLTRAAHNDWALSVASFVPSSAFPTNVTAAPATGGGTTTYRYKVTAIAANGVTESLPSDPAPSASSLVMSTTGTEHQTVDWDEVPGAQFYNVYRQAEVQDGVPATGQLYGFVGSATENQFVDANILPDFTRTPPLDFNPFEEGTSGYVSNLLVTPGNNYTVVPTLGFSGGGGAGAAATIGLGAVAFDFAFPGSGYTFGDELTVVGGTFTRPARLRNVTPAFFGGQLVNMTVVDPGNYSVLPPVGAFGEVTVTGGTGTGGRPFARWGLGEAVITNAGSGYTSVPAVAVIGAAGSPNGSVTAQIIIQALNNPGCSCYFQQRQFFAATVARPETFYASKTADYLNFTYSTPTRPDDSIIGTLASQQVNAIKHLVPLSSLIALTTGGAWAISSGTSGTPVTPGAINADPQVFNGCSDVPPLVIGRELLYIQAKQSVVRSLKFNFIENVYSGNDLTTLANHLFLGRRLVVWDYAEEPYKTIFAVRNDGVMLCFTYLPEQEVYAWTHYDTDGHFIDVCVIPEGDEDAVYVMVERYIQGAKHHYIERFASRDMKAVPEGVIDLSWVTTVAGPTNLTVVPADLSRAWFVDCGLQYPLTEPAATLFPFTTTAPLSIASLTLIAGGSGYVTTPAVVVTDATGSGAIITALISAGAVVALVVTAQGTDYTDPTISFDGGGGSGAVAAANLTRDVLMNASAGIFDSFDVGATLRVNHGYGVVRRVNSPSQVIVNVQRDLASSWPAEAGAWSCTSPVTVVSGLDHLEGKRVAILADGNVMPQREVIGGEITLDQPASAIFVGLPYRARFVSLYADVPGESPTVQGKRKKVSAVGLRVQEARGLRVGHNFRDMIDVKDRLYEAMGEAIVPRTGDERVVLSPLYDVAGQVCVEQVNPLPATILGLIPEITIGDTP